tara:strand:- start:37 stop:1128 length:1092 start_codon:yes stop_codon:yes gene_type:complete
MIKLKELLFEDESNKYTHIGYGKYKKKGEEDKEGSQTFKKDDSGKYIPTSDDKGEKGAEKKSVKKTKISADPFAKDDVGGPAYPNVPKGAKTSKEAIKAKQINDLNKQAEKGDGELIDTEYNGSVVWTSGDVDEDTFFATNEDGEEVEIGYDEIVRFHNNNDSVMKNLFGKSDEPTDEKEKWDSDKFDDFYDGTPDEDLKKNVDNISNTYLKSLAKFKKDGVEFADEEAASIKSDMIDDYIEKRFGLTRADDDHTQAYSKINDFVSDKEEEYYKSKMNKESIKLSDLLPEDLKLTEAKMVKLILPIKDRKKVVHILQKQLKLKVSKDFEYGGTKGSNFIIELDKKFENKVIELFMKSKIKVRG